MPSQEKMEFCALRGTEDLLGAEIARWVWLEARARDICRRFGFQEIRTPLIEEARLFTRSVGETTDIVQKEMYIFADRGGRQIALRPEGTASMVRAYVEHELSKSAGLVKWFSIGPMFRAERPQAGRRRQFHQIGVETIGATHPLLDAELITLALAILAALGIQGTCVRLNNVGCRADRERTSARLREQLAPHRAALCEECRERLERNVFRIIDCKRESCRRIVSQLSLAFEICADCRAHHAQVLEALRRAGIAVEEDPTIVRGLDYYTKTVFELSHDALGSQDALGAGGRYDNLVHELGGPDVGASGFALGIERLFMVRQALSIPDEPVGVSSVIVLALDEPAQQEGFKLLDELRRNGITAVMDFESQSLKSQMRSANKSRALVALLLGARERAQDVVTLKHMLGGGQETVPRSGVIAAVRKLIPIP